MRVVLHALMNWRESLCHLPKDGAQRAPYQPLRKRIDFYGSGCRSTLGEDVAHWGKTNARRFRQTADS